MLVMMHRLTLLANPCGRNTLVTQSACMYRSPDMISFLEFSEDTNTWYCDMIQWNLQCFQTGKSQTLSDNFQTLKISSRFPGGKNSSTLP